MHMASTTRPSYISVCEIEKPEWVLRTMLRGAAHNQFVRWCLITCTALVTLELSKNKSTVGKKYACIRK